jgi:hypothetical protein
MRYTVLNPKPTLYRAMHEASLNMQAAISYECMEEYNEALRKMEVYHMIRRIFQRHGGVK